MVRHRRKPQFIPRQLLFRQMPATPGRARCGHHEPLSGAHATGITLARDSGRTDAREVGMGVQRRDFLSLAILAAAAASAMAAFGQTVMPAVGPTRNQSGASIPD